MTFEWDETKNAENIAKHNVSFEEAQEVFYDVCHVTLEDTSHSLEEKRFFCIGKTENGILTVRYTTEIAISALLVRVIGEKEKEFTKNKINSL